MFVVKKLKLNKFVHVEIPKNAEYFARLGGLQPSIPSGVYSGDEVIFEGNKTDVLALADKENSRQLKKEKD